MTSGDLSAALGGAAVSFEVVPGVPITLAPLTMRDASAYHNFRKAHPDDHLECVCELIALSAQMPDGTKLTREMVADLPASAVEKISQRVMDLNGWGEAAGN